MAVMLGALTVGGVAYATIPEGVIHGCYNANLNSAGALRVIDVDKQDDLLEDETALNVNRPTRS